MNFCFAHYCVPVLKTIGAWIGYISHCAKNPRRNNLWEEEFLLVHGMTAVESHGGVAAAPGWGIEGTELLVHFSVD